MEKKKSIFIMCAVLISAFVLLLPIVTKQFDAKATREICNGSIHDEPGPNDTCWRAGDGCRRECGFLEQN